MLPGAAKLKVSVKLCAKVPLTALLQLCTRQGVLNALDEYPAAATYVLLAVGL